MTSRELPSATLRLPCQDLELPSANFNLSYQDFGLPSANFNLPYQNLELPSVDFRLPQAILYFLTTISGNAKTKSERNKPKKGVSIIGY
jgi:hypothetical protein